MNYQLSLSPKIIFKNKSIYEVGNFLSRFGNKILFLYGSSSLKKTGNYEIIVNSLKQNNIKWKEISGLSNEPTPDLIDALVKENKSDTFDSILAVGGGSVIDTAKAVAALLTNESHIEDYLEGVGKGLIIKNTPIPVIAVPTTAGSGAEATKNSVITNYESKYKKSFRDERNIPKLIIADALLTVSLSKEQTAFGGMDALCQLIESFITLKRNPYCQGLSSFFIPVAYNSLVRLSSDLNALDARSDMLQSSIASGISLANSGLGIVHGFASGIGGMFNIPHGLICAILLPHSIKLNISKNPDLYNEIANSINGNNDNNVEMFLEKIYKLNYLFNVPENFKSFNIEKDLSKEIVDRSQGSSMKGNPVSFSENELNDFIIGLI